MNSENKDNKKEDNVSQVSSGTNNQSSSTGTTKTTVSTGDKIKVDYIGKLESGEVFDTSILEEAKKAGTGVYNAMRPYQPLEFTVGAGQMIPGFDRGVVGMKIGETKSIKIEPKDGYGEYDENKFEELTKSQLKSFEDAGIELKVGNSLPTQYGNLKILSVVGEKVKIDTNHSLAGKVLVFDVTLKDIK